jgi:hypothetical protein
LHTRGFITLADPDPKKEVTAQAILTTDGTVRYQHLCRHRLIEDKSAVSPTKR